MTINVRIDIMTIANSVIVRTLPELVLPPTNRRHKLLDVVDVAIRSRELVADTTVVRTL